MAGTKETRGRPFKFPDPAERSRSEPSFIADSKRILGLYNAATEEGAKYVTEKVQAWFGAEAKRLGWDEVEPIGNQCKLTMNL